MQPQWEDSKRLSPGKDSTTDMPAEGCALKFIYNSHAYQIPETTALRQTAQIRLCARADPDSSRKTFLQLAHSSHQRWDIARAATQKGDEQ